MKRGETVPGEDPHESKKEKKSSEIRPDDDVCADLISAERYQAFIENIQEGIYEIDIQGRFVYFNDALCRIFGYSREEIQFQNFSRFMDEEYAARGFSTFNSIYRTGRGVSDLIWKIHGKQGETKFIELSAHLIVNEKGEKTGFRGIARDITDKFKTQEALKESERRYRILLDFIPYPVVVFTTRGRVSYLNPAFSETFGWTLEELEGKNIPYVPKGLEQETRDGIKRLFEEKTILRFETQRLTKDGRTLDIILRAAVFSENDDEETSGEIVILRDVTREKSIARNNEALLKLGLALPEYPDLEDLLDYISGEIKRLIKAEGALLILLDEEKNELFFKAAAHDDSVAERKVKEVRFPADKGVAGEVIRTGEPIIVPDTSKDPHFYSVVDEQAGFTTRSMLDVPLKHMDRTVGVICVLNKKTGTFDRADVELLNMLSPTIALSIENARYSDELKDAYKEVTSLNRAKDRVINHLSHELRTPLSVLGASLNIFEKRLHALPGDTWKPTLERARRNLQRVLEIQYQVEDIMQGRSYDTHHMLLLMLDECIDEMEAIVAEEAGEGPLVQKIRKKIDALFGPGTSPSEMISIHEFVSRTIEETKPLFSHRDIALVTRLDPVPDFYMPREQLRKVVVGLIKNAVENTPDGGRIEISTRKKGNGSELLVHDYGVGITSENKRRIFEGFFATQETMDYSSKEPFDFNAGGKGADLLRMKIFSERYGFQIHMTSSRCRHIPHDKDICPGKITDCEYCTKLDDCYDSGGSVFAIYFPPVAEETGLSRDSSQSEETRPHKSIGPISG